MCGTFVYSTRPSLPFLERWMKKIHGRGQRTIPWQQYLTDPSRKKHLCSYPQSTIEGVFWHRRFCRIWIWEFFNSSSSYVIYFFLISLVETWSLFSSDCLCKFQCSIRSSILIVAVLKASSLWDETNFKLVWTANYVPIKKSRTRF